MNRRRPILRTLTLLAALATFGVVSPGCNIVAPAFLIIHGPPKVKKQYELDANRSTVVFVDDRANVMPRRSLRTVMTQSADEMLINKDVVKQENVLTSVAAMQVASQERYGSPKTIVEIGRAIDAEVVIYISMVDWSLTRDGVSMAPTMRARVKVIDAKENKRLWPNQTVNGYPVTVELPAALGAQPETRAERAQVEAELAKIAGVKVARLFFTHPKDQLSGELDD